MASKEEPKDWMSSSEDESEAHENDIAEQVDFVKLGGAAKRKLASASSHHEGSKAGSKKEGNPKQESRVIYLGHVPHGFFEDQMKGFFTQFGVITKLRLSRSRKTGRSRGYAFIEFEDPAVAAVVAETMQGYILFDHRLVCHVVPAESLHADLFKGASKKFKPVPWRTIAKKRHNAPRSAEQQQRLVSKLLTKEKAKRRKLTAVGISYEFDGYTSRVPRKAKKTVFAQD